MNEERETRYRRDWFTNPTFKDYVERLEEMHRKEEATLKGFARGDSITKINHQQGVVDGIERVQAMLEQMNREALGIEA
jgi:hypothetical protein